MTARLTFTRTFGPLHSRSADVGISGKIVLIRFSPPLPHPIDEVLQLFGKQTPELKKEACHGRQ
jgi:hypothetical protein